MVNTKNISQYDAGNPPEDEDSPRGIVGGPIYSIEQVHEILDQGERALQLWTRKCIQDVQALSFDHSDVIQLLKEAIGRGRYVGSEWSVQKAGGPWVASDAYVITRKEWNDRAFKDLDCEYYVKFSIAKSGKIVLTVSCHLSR